MNIIFVILFLEHFFTIVSYQNINLYIIIYYNISFKLDLKLKFNNKIILILNTICNQYAIAIYSILGN